MEILSLIADLLAILAAVFAFLGWRQSVKNRIIADAELIRKMKKVKVVLQSGVDKIELPVELRRGEFTRPEVLGRIGMIPMQKKGERFSLGYLNTPEFWRDINRIADGTDDDVLTIPCKTTEFNQFDLASFRVEYDSRA